MDRLERRVSREKWEGMEKEREEEREKQLEIEMERGIERKRNEVVNCDRISTNGVVENTCVFFEY